MVKGQIVSGDYGSIIVRQKSDKPIELGELLISEHNDVKILLQCFDLVYGSQISRENLELMSGLKLEEENDLEILDADLRIYSIARLRPLLKIVPNNVSVCKELPAFFSTVREVERNDLWFLKKPDNPLQIGTLRSGSKIIDIDIHLKGEKVLSEHMLICSATGKGKSNLTKAMLLNLLDKKYAGMLILDPHDEYYGKAYKGLSNHPKAKNWLVYYTPKRPPTGQRTLKINLQSLKPWHFNIATTWTDAQNDAISMYYREYSNKWIEAILKEQNLTGIEINPLTLNVLKRKMMNMLNIIVKDTIVCRGVFDINSGVSTVEDICSELEKGKKVVIDTSSLRSKAELLIGSVIANEIYSKYRHYKQQGTLDQKPVISIVIEEAPRVLGKDITEGSNIFKTLAKEGRKFKVGIIAITQLPSLIPRDILANLNTKIILGIEMGNEREAVINASAQDLSKDSRSIASLDKGEAIVSSTFTRFAIPIKAPYYEDVIDDMENKSVKEKYSDTKKAFTGMS